LPPLFVGAASPPRLIIRVGINLVVFRTLYTDCGCGLLAGLPLRLIFGIRMLFSEIAVWALAIAINVVAMLYLVEYYQTTKLTMLLRAILTTPYPYWSVILLSGTGTFLSIRSADELMDVARHRDREFFHRHSFKHEVVIIVFFVVILFGYYKLIASLGINAGF